MKEKENSVLQLHYSLFHAQRPQVAGGTVLDGADTDVPSLQEALNGAGVEEAEHRSR